MSNLCHAEIPPLGSPCLFFSFTLSSSSPQSFAELWLLHRHGHGSNRGIRLFYFRRGKWTRAADVEILWARAPAGNMGGVGGVMLFLRAKLW